MNKGTVLAAILFALFARSWTIAETLGFESLRMTGAIESADFNNIDWDSNKLQALKMTMMELSFQLDMDEKLTSDKVTKLKGQIYKILSKVHVMGYRPLDEQSRQYCETLYCLLKEACSEKNSDNRYSQILSQEKYQSTLNQLSSLAFANGTDKVKNELSKIEEID